MPLLFPPFFRVYFRAGNLVDQSMTADMAGEVTSAAGPVRLADLQRILSSIQPSGMS
jgi:26S proteasome regulatory subunit N13